MKSLYVTRPVLNIEDFYNWAFKNNIKTLATNLHVSIAYSEKQVEWSKWEPQNWEVRLKSSGDRKIELFAGDAHVLSLGNPAILRMRWAQFINEGCSWGYEDFSPHITWGHKFNGNIESINPYTGRILLGPEVFKTVEED